ncbi:MAG TPA: phosphatase PAP2 family protein [Vicinamibacterales bacterium]|nr:phosphatase PAP2 family protein [Vicinamibacterales bacterium]
MRKAKAGFHKLKTHLASRDREELWLLAGTLALLGVTQLVANLAGEVLEGDTLEFDKRLLSALRKADDPSQPIGPAWLEIAALDVTALGSASVLGLTVVAVVGFLALQGMYRNAGFVFLASAGGWLLNGLLKDLFARPRPDVVPHLREVMSLSFPSGHALTSAAVFLTLGALLMRVAESRLAKFYCMFVAMVATLLVGATRVYLGVHYPTDVLAGWLIGLSWALFCWLVERSLERRAGLKRERMQAASQP